MNRYLESIDIHVSRMRPGQRIEIEHRNVEDAFPHPPPMSMLEMDFEICRLLSAPRGEVEANPEPPTQQEQIDRWAERRNLKVWRDAITRSLHVEKLQPRGECCGVPLVPSRGQRFKPRPSPRPDRLPTIDEVIQLEHIEGMCCPECGKFIPLES